ncbi:response regulator transcription factor [Dactylosporangium sp. NPDC005572]|uniref:response regulator transcription factor n=1 Tax=Dactylosporangium sp. NPDC005572 TaxID=3156889 RepID=UPI0033B4C4A9
MIRVLLVDDQALVRTGFRLILDQTTDIAVIGEAASGTEALNLAWTTHPDVVLMDVRMPGMDGIEATRRLLDSGHSQPPKIIILTTFDLDEYVFAGLQAGASGFLLKDALAGDLLTAVRTVAAGQAVAAPSVTRRLIEHFVTSRTPQRDESRLSALSVREREVLTLIARGLTNAEIAERLVLSEGTVKTHINHILSKLAVRDRVQAVILAYQTGLVDTDQ